MEPRELDGLAELVRRRLAGRIRDLRLVLREDGIVLQGRVCSYYGKQLAQHEVSRVVNAARLVNEIEVSPIASDETAFGGGAAGSFFMNQTLLIADGDAELCDVYRRFFACQGFNLETAFDGLDCLEKLRRVMPTVLVIALELCWGGGDGVLAWLREQGAESGVPVILTYTAGNPPPLAAFTEPPVVDHLCKPFELTALLESVRSPVARSGALKRNPTNNP